ncbi:catalase [Acetoanaerobium pronyense]|uniref:Catalase n=1 Tax=Acetoanaerobium pronyense TaxID=1482736 RepID=A0ABS4KK48_9FIRM|nr:catalase [Acetoanaerobium pronyense]MBP2028154.1 catalase [Acetoanaerobium pronyense]
MDPRKKNNLGENLPSKNDHKGKTTEIKTGAGAPVGNNQDTLTAGKRGPAMLQDVWFLEKMAHFDREVIPERRMHAKGSGAFGEFTVTHDITKYTKASIFSEIGKKTQMFARFSTVAGERGAADAERDIRGFALKFYTDEGNWDMVGNNTPVFFFRDPMKFIDLNHAIKRDPRTNMRSPNTNWDFWTSLPEALLQVTIVMSDRGIPSSYRFMHGFSSHAYSFINANNERTWVKFHFRSNQGIQNFTDQEAEMIIAGDRESHQRDLYEAIEKKKYPKWTMYVQLMTEEQARNMQTNPFDLTKMWPKKDFPLIEVGEFVLNKNPDNYFQDVEQAAFAPSNVVPGISFSPDRMLQGRLFSYGDAHRYRLGVNHHQIPVNSPKGVENPHAFHRDGQMRVDGNLGSELHYEPNSYGNWTESERDYEPKQDGGHVYRYDFREDDHDYYTQPGMLFRAMTKEQKQVLCENTARNMADATLQIKHRHINNCYQADKEYGEGVAKALNINIEDVDLNLPKRDSKENNYKANNAHPELDKPSEDMSKKDWQEIKTDYDPKSFIDPMKDPYLL